MFLPCLIPEFSSILLSPHSCLSTPSTYSGRRAQRTSHHAPLYQRYPNTWTAHPSTLSLSFVNFPAYFFLGVPRTSEVSSHLHIPPLRSWGLFSHTSSPARSHILTAMPEFGGAGGGAAIEGGAGDRLVDHNHQYQWTSPPPSVASLFKATLEAWWSSSSLQWGATHVAQCSWDDVLVWRHNRKMLFSWVCSCRLWWQHMTFMGAFKILYFCRICASYYNGYVVFYIDVYSLIRVST